MKILSIPISLALLLLLAGFFMRILHWPYSFELNLIGLTSLGTLYITRYAAKKSKSLKDSLKVLVVLLWITVTILGVLEFGYIPYLVYLALVVGVIWLGIEVNDVLLKKGSKSKTNPVLWVGIIFMILFVLIKVLYWPFGSIVYLFGLLFSAIGFIVDFVLHRKKEDEIT